MGFHLKHHRLWVLGASILSIFLLVGVSMAAVGDITISAPSGASPGAGFTSEIQADVGGMVLGSYAVTFTFNKDVLQITAVQGGSTVEFSGAPTYGDVAAANVSGQINIAAFQASFNSPKNLVSIFRIGFTVIGASGSSSTLSMNVNDLADPNFNSISHQVIPATVTVDATPAVTTDVVSSITGTTAASGGNVTSDGGSSVTARGVCWRTSTGPTIADGKTENGTGTGAFTSIMTGLTQGTTYYMRAYATSSVGTGYGSERIFVTLDLPIVSTTSVSEVTANSAKSGGSVTSDGGADVMARGGCWSTLENPTIADGKTSDGTGTGTFVSSITDLNPGTTYHVRAYATNSVGTRYGDDLIFTTVADKPTVATTAVSSVTHNSAQSGGNVTSNGGADVTERGVCWSTFLSPTIHDSKTSDGTGTGTFVSSITDLYPGTDYYVRAYATNSAGTSYGSELTFSTQAVEPTVATTTPSNITLGSAQSGGNVTDDGGADVTERGVCWSTVANPTTADDKTTDGNGTGVFISNIKNLSPGTAYHVRAYAVNSVGAGYGSDLSFTTQDLTTMNISYSWVKDDDILKSEIASFSVSQQSDGSYAGSFTDSEGISHEQNGTFFENNFFWTTTPATGTKANGKGAVLGMNINGRQDVAGSVEPVQMRMNPTVMTSPDLTGFWSMTFASYAWGWNDRNGPDSRTVDFYAEANGSPNQYEGTFEDGDGSTNTITLTVDGNKIGLKIQNSNSTFQAQGTGTLEPGDGSSEVMGTFVVKSLLTEEPDGRNLGKFFATFTHQPVGELLLGSPPPVVFSGDSFTIPLMMDVGATVLGSYSVKILFDPEVVNITEVTGGTTSEFSGAPTVNMNNVDGFVSIAAFQTADNSPTGVVHVADLTFDVVGLPGEMTELAIGTPYDIFDPNSNPITLSAEGTTVTIANSRVDVGTVAPMAVMTEDTLDIPINIGWALNQVIGAYSFKLTFDPLVFEATAVAGGTTSEFAGAPTAGIDNDNGYVSFNSFNSSTISPVGFADVARITLMAIGEEDVESIVKLEVIDLVNQDSSIMDAYVENVKIIVSTGLCGDVNENDRVDIGDAMFIAQYDVGNRDASTMNLDVADTNVNGRVDIGDAMFIAQFDVGNRDCICVGAAMEYCGEE